MPTCVMLKLLMFQSTLPTRGSDQIISENVFYDLMFQSTLPTRGSDPLARTHNKKLPVSIHAPHEGERRMACGQLRTGRGFNPRSPRGGAT